MPTALVVGGDSRIGRAVAVRLSERGWRVLATTRQSNRAGPDRPLVDLAACAEADPVLPPCDVCLIAAAIVRLDECRRDPEATRRINVDATIAVARAVAAGGGFVLFLSTNLVFDGSQPMRRPGDRVNPHTAYGAQKAEAEAAILGLGDRGAVLRLTKVLVPDAPRIVGWVKDLRAGREVKAFGDMTIAPVTLESAANAAVRVLEMRTAGIHQLSGDEDITYADVARRVAAMVRADPGLVIEVGCKYGGVPVEFAPANTTLDSADIARLGLTAPTTVECLNAVLPQMTRVEA